MKKSINEIFRECAKADGMCTCMYARIAEANYLMDDVKQYPVLLRQFNETISETKLSVTRCRTTTLYFCDALGKGDRGAAYCRKNGRTGIRIYQSATVNGPRSRTRIQCNAFLRKIRCIGGGSDIKCHYNIQYMLICQLSGK